MQDPLVSIIIPTYNYGHYIKETLDCSLKQNYGNIEVIVINDGSTDNTAVILSKYVDDNRVRYLYQENSGLSSARNAGLKVAKGKYIQFLDADDLISIDKIRLQVAQLEADNSLAISYSYSFYFRGNDPETLFKSLLLNQEEWMPDLNGDKYKALEKLVRSNIMPVNSALLRYNILGKTGFFNVEYKSLEDWEFWLNCAFKGMMFRFLDNKEAFALIRVHDRSMSHNKTKMYDYEVKLRLKVKEWILNMENAEREQAIFLDALNSRCLHILVSLILRRNGFLASKTVFPLIGKVGIKVFCKSLLKALNDARKEGRNNMLNAVLFY